MYISAQCYFMKTSNTWPKEKKGIKQLLQLSQWKNSNITQKFSICSLFYPLLLRQVDVIKGLKAKVTQGAIKQGFKYRSVPVFQALSIILEGQKRTPTPCLLFHVTDNTSRNGVSANGEDTFCNVEAVLLQDRHRLSSWDSHEHIKGC